MTPKLEDLQALLRQLKNASGRKSKRLNFVGFGLGVNLLLDMEASGMGNELSMLIVGPMSFSLAQFQKGKNLTIFAAIHLVLTQNILKLFDIARIRYEE